MNNNENQSQENNSEQINQEAREYAHDAAHCLVYRNFKASVELYNKAIELNPKISDWYYHRGIAYKKLNQIDLAEKDFQKAAELEPSILTNYKLK